MDAHLRKIPQERNPSSARVFGEWSLRLSSSPGPVSSSIFFASDMIEAAHRALAVAAHRRLLSGAREVVDLMAGADSYMPDDLEVRLVGVSADGPALAQNERLDHRIVHDLNESPTVPLPDRSCDAVVVSFDAGRLTRPLELFRDVGRILRPGGVVAISFMHPFFGPELTEMWSLGDDHEHVVLAEAFIEFATCGFRRPSTSCLYHRHDELAWSPGGPPPDRSQPYLYVVHAFLDGAPPRCGHQPPFPPPPAPPPKNAADLRFDDDGRPHCPYCGTGMRRYAPPVTIFEIDYGVAELYVCFEDACPYYRRGKHWMRSQGHAGYTYRFMWNPDNNAAGPIPDSLTGGLDTCRID